MPSYSLWFLFSQILDLHFSTKSEISKRKSKQIKILQELKYQICS